MDLGWYIPNCHYGASLDAFTGGKPFPPGMAIDPETFAATATAAEELGFATLWLGDHVIIPPATSVAFGRLRPGDALRGDAPVYDAFTVLAYLAAITTRVKLGIGIIVIPYRNPVVTARMLVSIDRLSGGRVIAGASGGWLRDEFETLQVSYADRGPITDDYLQVMRALWTEERPRYEGVHYSLDGGSAFEPKPVNGTIPIWIGGHTRRALERTVRLGDGYLGDYLPPDEAGRTRARLHELLAAAGRDPAQVAYAGQTRYFVTDDPYPDAPPGIGSPEKVADDIMRFAEAGLEQLKLSPPPGPTTAAVLEQLHRFADEVRPRLDL
jgi:probable F420-dependent oxidoreductase